MLINLKSLAINTQITDLKPFKELSNLQYLYLKNTQITSLEPLEGLKNLNTLYINETQVSNLEPLEALINLEKLDISVCNNISDEQFENLQIELPKLSIKR